MTTIIEEENPDDFIKYMFDTEPKPKDSIQLECPDIPPNKNTHLHIFEQLLMIYVSGLKHLWQNEDGKVDLTELTEDNIWLMKRYFESINYIVNIDVFDLNTTEAIVFSSAVSIKLIRSFLDSFSFRFLMISKLFDAAKTLFKTLW